MARKAEASENPDELVPVIMDRISTLWLSHYDHQDDRQHLQTARQVKTAILPGLNYKPKSILQAAGVGTRMLNVRLKVADPCALDYYDQQALAEKTTSKDALRMWRDRETNPETIAMLDKRIHGMAGE